MSGGVAAPGNRVSKNTTPDRSREFGRRPPRGRNLSRHRPPRPSGGRTSPLSPDVRAYRRPRPSDTTNRSDGRTADRTRTRSIDGDTAPVPARTVVGVGTSTDPSGLDPRDMRLYRPDISGSVLLLSSANVPPAGAGLPGTRSATPSCSPPRGGFAPRVRLSFRRLLVPPDEHGSSAESTTTVSRGRRSDPAPPHPEPVVSIPDTPGVARTLGWAREGRPGSGSLRESSPGQAGPGRPVPKS